MAIETLGFENEQFFPPYSFSNSQSCSMIGVQLSYVTAFVWAPIKDADMANNILSIAFADGEHKTFKDADAFRMSQPGVTTELGVESLLVAVCKIHDRNEQNRLKYQRGA